MDGIGLKEAFEKTRKNFIKLKSCLGLHDFIEIEDNALSRCKCSKCGGEVESVFAHAYKNGIEHFKLSLKDEVLKWRDKESPTLSAYGGAQEFVDWIDKK